MSALQNEIDRLNTLKESFSELSKKVLDTQAVLTELNNGKQEIVEAITNKGGDASTDYSLGELAQSIRNINIVDFDTNGAEFTNGLIPKSLGELLANKDNISKISDDSTTALTVDGGLSGLANLETVSLRNCETISGSQFANCSNLKKVVLPKVQIVDGLLLRNCKSVQEINLRSAIKIRRNTQTESFCKSFSELSELDLTSLELTQVPLIFGPNQIYNFIFPNLRCIASRDDNNVSRNFTAFSGDYIHTLEMPKLEQVTGDTYNYLVNSDTITRLQVGVLTESSYYHSAINASGSNLIDIEIGDGYNNDLIFRWSPNNCYTDEEKLKILNENIRNHIVAKLADLTDKTSKTITFLQALMSSSNPPANTELVNHFDEETMAAFAAKNWNISPAKSI